MSGPHPVLAIDGPAGTGKSTTARRVAQALGWRHIDSGAFYRLAALLALRAELDLEGEAGRRALRDDLAARRIDSATIGGRFHVLVDGEDVTDAIRSPAVTAVVARAADDPGLRAIVNEALRRRAAEGPAVVDGRDIGTVVFPDAFLKVHLDASIEERARRRAREEEPPDRAGDESVLASHAARIAERDRADRARPAGPLTVAPDAVHIDTSDIDLDTQVARILVLVRERAARLGFG